MQSFDSLEMTQTLFSSSELEAMLSQTAHLDLGVLPKDLDLPFDDIEGLSSADCFQSDEGRVASECHEYTANNNQINNVDHDYEGTEYAHSFTDNEFVCSPSSVQEDEEIDKPSSSRPKRNIIRRRYESDASENSLALATPTTRRVKINEEESNKAMSKNAIAARENRQKKKAYITNLEAALKKKTAESKVINEENVKLKRNNAALISEVSYLRGVLANVPELSALIRSIQKTPGIKEVTTSFGGNSKQNSTSGKRKCSFDENTDECARKSARLSLKTKDALSTAGVCMHVANGVVSLEFCQMCSSKARRGLHK